MYEVPLRIEELDMERELRNYLKGKGKLAALGPPSEFGLIWVVGKRGVPQATTRDVLNEPCAHGGASSTREGSAITEAENSSSGPSNHTVRSNPFVRVRSTLGHSSTPLQIL